MTDEIQLPPPGPRDRNTGRQAKQNDFTGRKREALQREHSAELTAREGEISSAANERARSVAEDIVDYSPEGLAAAEEAVLDAAKVAEEAGELVGTPGSAAAVYQLPEDAPSLKEAVPADRLNYLVVIRAASDIEDMTFGAGNHYSFTEGRRYRVPRYIAMHLEEKALVYH